jgi:hypothetical protein
MANQKTWPIKRHGQSKDMANQKTWPIKRHGQVDEHFAALRMRGGIFHRL